MRKILILFASAMLASTLFSDDGGASSPDYSQGLIEIAQSIESTKVSHSNITEAIQEASSNYVIQSSSNARLIAGRIESLTKAVIDLTESLEAGELTPDYDRRIQVGSGYTVRSRGYIQVQSKSMPPAGYRLVYVNSCKVFVPFSKDAAKEEGVYLGSIPVGYGDTVTISNMDANVALYWVPVSTKLTSQKPILPDYDRKEELDKYSYPFHASGKGFFLVTGDESMRVYINNVEAYLSVSGQIANVECERHGLFPVDNGDYLTFIPPGAAMTPPSSLTNDTTHAFWVPPK